MTPVNALADGVLVQNLLWDQGKFPISQLVVPPIMLYTSSVAIVGSAFQTGGASTIRGESFIKIDFRDQDGNGIPYSNGLVIFKLGTDVGTVYQIETRKAIDNFRGDIPGNSNPNPLAKREDYLNGLMAKDRSVHY